MWQLQGHDSRWITSTENTAQYSNLQPGHYTLLLKAKDGAGKMSEVYQLHFSISAPFYQRWWFLLLCFLAICGVVYLFVQQRVNTIKEKFALRNKIAADLHDDIGSAITSINMLSASTQLTMDTMPEKAHDMIEKISAESKQIQQNLSDIVWSIKPENSKIENLTARMREYAAHTLEPGDIVFEMHVDEAFASKFIQMQYRKDILLIFKEAIANIVKHAKATQVIVNIGAVGKNLELQIIDNGTWRGAGTGSGLKTMTQRAKAIGGDLSISGTLQGTTITLQMPIT
jgi:two-component system, NarL family, sensor histidine kinase UhpB